MHAKYKWNIVPVKSLSILFILWSNSKYATYGKNVGFFCDDESIKKPYYGDTVHTTYLLGSLLGIFALIIYLTETIFKTEGTDEKSRIRIQYRILLKSYYSGFLYVLLSTEILKCFISELRPHFFTTCLPDLSKVDCSKGLITHFNCTGVGSQWLVERDIYKSFPSGHATTSVYAFIFMCGYLNYKRRTLNIWWIRCVILICFAWSLFCCVSRITDNRHHWWDVLAGMFLGLVGGFSVISLTLKKVADRLENLEHFKR